jgi:hypothetical protein
VKAWLRCLLVALLLVDASGVLAFMSPEECLVSTDAQSHRDCDAFCVRCVCCAQPVVPAQVFVALTSDVIVTPQPPLDARLLTTSPPDVFHVPKVHLV